ncbi:MAG: thioredoxin family protein [Luteolibacter sp.]
METLWKIAPAAVAAVFLAACGGGGEDGIDLKNAMPPSGVGPRIRSPDGGTAVTPGGNQNTPFIGVTPQEDIVFTDPDNPDAGIPELESLMAAPKKGPWEESETIARQTAAREGKPILVWFTDSQRSPMCKALTQELFGQADFGKWADQHVVRLRVDSNIAASKDPKMTMDEWDDMKSNVSDYVKRMKKRYRVLGHPTLLMLNPSGEVLWKDTGFKRGQADFLWGIIKQNEIASTSAYNGWRKSLEDKGYREWKGKGGRKVFAKLISYSEGTLVLVEPGGERFKTHESRLSSGDKKWIEQQKAMRGIQ